MHGNNYYKHKFITLDLALDIMYLFLKLSMIRSHDSVKEERIRETLWREKFAFSQVLTSSASFLNSLPLSTPLPLSS